MRNKLMILAICILGAAPLVKAEKRVSTITPKDTIEVKFGEKGKILIQVESKEDLDALKEYDINSMLEDIKVPEETIITEKVIIRDEKGTRYLKDSIEDDEFRELEMEFEEEEDADDEVEIRRHYDRKPKRFSGSKTDFVAGLDWGINNFMTDGQYPDANDDQYAVRPWGSWYVALAPTWQTHIAGKFAIDYGAGFSWYNYKFQDPRTRLVEQDGFVEFDQWDVNLQSSKSKLTVAHINAYLVPVLDFGYRTNKKTYDDGFVQTKTRYRRNGFRIGAGGYVGTRIDSYQKLVWKETGHKSKLRERDNFYLENFRYGARFILGYGEVDMFVNYDLSTVFAKDKGPELNAITFGLSF
ncbi:MAG: hypothetical protein HC819_15205 [Cyclobacteriaceae bacterium]|nr:hypothetical protein [Cyclobacteriaceae bacterium]